MNYPDSVQFLYALGNEIKTAKLGLERIRAVLGALGNPQERCRIVHVAGTNGKGSTCAMIESALRAAGRCTGLFTSPHLAEPTERIRIGGRPISAEEFADAFNRVHRAAETLLDAGAIDLHPTYFETVTAMALAVFAGRTDMVVLEVGLGGRLDATNVVTPELCVITPVDYDHEAYLGTSLESIAGEKAGILKAGVPAVFAGQRAEAARVLERRAAELRVPVTHASSWVVSGVEMDACGSRFDVTGEFPLRVECPLPGSHQVENAVTAAVALVRLGTPAAAIRTGIAGVEWPGRLERVSERPEIILDGAHNPAGARALAGYIQSFYADRPVRLIFGAMRDKAVEEIGGILFPLARQVILTAPKQARAISPEAMREVVGHPDLRVAADIEEALAMVRDAGPEEAIFVTGSLFLVGEARTILRQSGDSAAALRAFFKIAGIWSLTEDEQRALLGWPPESTFCEYKDGRVASLAEETLVRISLVLGIYKALQILYRETDLADRWIRLPNNNALFGGKPALVLMMEGGMDGLYQVRRLLDGRRGGWN